MNTNDYELLGHLGSMTSDFPELQALHRSGSYSYHHLFVPQVIKELGDMLHINFNLVSEAIGFLDIAGVFSLMSLGDESTFIEGVKRTISVNRHSVNTNMLISESGTEDYLYRTSEELKEFLDSNPVLVGIYLYLMVSVVTSFNTTDF